MIKRKYSKKRNSRRNIRRKSRRNSKVKKKKKSQKKMKGGSLCNSKVNVSDLIKVNKLSQSEHAFESRYFVGKQAGGGYYFNLAGKRVGGLPQLVKVQDPLPAKFVNNKNTYQKPLYLQKGAANIYNKIINPKTGRKVSVFGKKGKIILNKYLNKIN
tara:strand:+ start:2536 stop:3006 length:471 start_codon:yes stop_codon:yes gene_type:complete